MLSDILFAQFSNFEESIPVISTYYFLMCRDNTLNCRQVKMESISGNDRFLKAWQAEIYQVFISEL
jgi:hypothetical protein